MAWLHSVPAAAIKKRKGKERPGIINSQNSSLKCSSSMPGSLFSVPNDISSPSYIRWSLEAKGKDKDGWNARSFSFVC